MTPYLSRRVVRNRTYSYPQNLWISAWIKMYILANSQCILVIYIILITIWPATTLCTKFKKLALLVQLGFLAQPSCTKFDLCLHQYCAYPSYAWWVKAQFRAASRQLPTRVIEVPAEFTASTWHERLLTPNFSVPDHMGIPKVSRVRKWVMDSPLVEGGDELMYVSYRIGE